MPRSTETSRADTSRARLLEAAVSAFAEKGFYGTSTRDIAAAAGMSPAAVYVHHRSKEELLYLISRAGHERALAIVLEGMASSGDPVEQLRRVIRDFSAHHASVPTEARIVNYELAALSPEHLKEIEAIRHRIDREIRHLIERGVAAGVFTSPDPRITAAALLSLSIDIGRWYRPGGHWTPEEIGEHYAEIALRIVGART